MGFWILSNTALIDVDGSLMSQAAVHQPRRQPFFVTAGLTWRMSISCKGFRLMSSSDRLPGAKYGFWIAEWVFSCSACVVTPVTHLND
jgi:hypothetical protein